MNFKLRGYHFFVHQGSAEFYKWYAQDRYFPLQKTDPVKAGLSCLRFILVSYLLFAAMFILLIGGIWLAVVMDSRSRATPPARVRPAASPHVSAKAH